MHHIAIGRLQTGTRIILLIADLDVGIIHATTGEIGHAPPRWAVHLHQHASNAATANGTSLVRTRIRFRPPRLNRPGMAGGS